MTTHEECLLKRSSFIEKLEAETHTEFDRNTLALIEIAFNTGWIEASREYQPLVKQALNLAGAANA